MTDRDRLEYVQIGRVCRAHGVQGEIAVEVLSDVPGRFEVGAEFLVVPAGSQPSTPRRRVRVSSRRPHQGRLLIRLEGIETREQADELRGSELEIAIEQSPKSPLGSYYYYELLGCSCHDGQAGLLGEVSNVVEDGGGLLLEVRQGRRTVMIPFVKEYLLAVDRKQNRIELALPPGLIDTCTSPS